MATTTTTNNKRDSTSMDDQKHFWELLQDFKEVFLISRTTEGKEHGRPMRIISAKQNEGVYFFTSLQSPKVYEIQHDDHITITAQKKDEWLYACGKATVITDKAKIKELWTDGVRPWFPAGTNDSDVSLICVIPHTGEYWDQSSLATKIKFAWEFGKALATGNKIQKVEELPHGKVELNPTAAM